MRQPESSGQDFYLLGSMVCRSMVCPIVKRTSSIEHYRLHMVYKKVRGLAPHASLIMTLGDAMLHPSSSMLKKFGKVPLLASSSRSGTSSYPLFEGAGPRHSAICQASGVK